MLMMRISEVTLRAAKMKSSGKKRCLIGLCKCASQSSIFMIERLCIEISNQIISFWLGLDLSNWEISVSRPFCHSQAHFSILQLGFHIIYHQRLYVAGNIIRNQISEHLDVYFTKCILLTEHSMVSLSGKSQQESKREITTFPTLFQPWSTHITHGISIIQIQISFKIHAPRIPQRSRWPSFSYRAFLWKNRCRSPLRAVWMEVVLSDQIHHDSPSRWVSRRQW